MKDKDKITFKYNPISKKSDPIDLKQGSNGEFNIFPLESFVKHFDNVC